MHGLINEEVNFCTTKIRRAFRRSVPFLKDFWEPTLVGAKVVFLVGHDKTLYTMATSISTKRWTLPLLKLDEPFDARFYFENFLREPTSVNVRVVLLVEDDTTLCT